MFHTAAPTLVLPRRVEREIERQHVHARLAEEAEWRVLGEPVDQCADLFDVDLSPGGNARGLMLRGRG